MLAKKTVKNQITLPKKIADNFPGIDYFEVEADKDRIVLKPLRANRSDEVRQKLKSLKISEKDIASAVAWARKAGK
jgi:bifunctional DNA-binding transcriptional regulator/antitoxin component of YhaV-PrlF toxin-antitoxin module